MNFYDFVIAEAEKEIIPHLKGLGFLVTKGFQGYYALSVDKQAPKKIKEEYGKSIALCPTIEDVKRFCNTLEKL